MKKRLQISIIFLLILTVQTSLFFSQPPSGASSNCVSGNCYTGKGKIVSSNGDSYEGDFANGEIEGTGHYSFKNIGEYEGHFFKGKRHGKGKMIFEDGSSYEGDWVQDQIDGQGTIIFPDSSFYTGAFTNGFRNGKGKFTYATGDSYEGDFVINRMEGKGIYKSGEGKTYIGEFKNNAIKGIGKEVDSKGNILRSGLWDDNELIKSDAISK